MGRLGCHRRQIGAGSGCRRRRGASAGRNGQRGNRAQRQRNAEPGAPWLQPGPPTPPAVLRNLDLQFIVFLLGNCPGGLPAITPTVRGQQSAATVPQDGAWLIQVAYTPPTNIPPAPRTSTSGRREPFDQLPGHPRGIGVRRDRAMSLSETRSLSVTRFRRVDPAPFAGVRQACLASLRAWDDGHVARRTAEAADAWARSVPRRARLG